MKKRTLALEIALLSKEAAHQQNLARVIPTKDREQQVCFTYATTLLLYPIQLIIFTFHVFL